jgi:hypothetical protein
VLFNDSYENAQDYARKRAFRNRPVCDAGDAEKRLAGPVFIQYRFA